MKQINFKTLKQYKQIKQYFCKENVRFFNTDMELIKVFKHKLIYYIIDNIRIDDNSEINFIIKKFNPNLTENCFEKVQVFKNIDDAVNYLNNNI